MIRSLLVFLLLLFSVPAGIAQQGYLEVVPSGSSQPQLAIAAPTPLTGSPKTETAQEIAEVLRFDLDLTGLFAVSAAPVSERRSGIRAGEFDFSPWQAAGTELLVKTGYTLDGSRLVTEFRLYDVRRQKELLAKRYTGTPRELRRMAHTFADDLLQTLTGERGPFTGKIAFVSRRSGAKEVYLMDYDGANVQKLTGNGSINLNPDFSPTGKELIYTSYKQRNPDLYRRELLTGSEARISAHRGLNATAAFAPDGKRIALTLSKDGTSEIYTMNKDGKELSRLTRGSAINVAPAWSPDGSRIAFVSDRLGKPQVFVMNADGSNVQRLTTSGAYNVSPRWSPKGDWIAYARQEGGGFQLYLIRPDGSGDQRLTSEGSNEHPRWSPDGRFITFSSKRGGQESVYVMRADGTGQTRVSRGGGSDSHPAWSPRW